MLQVTTPVFQEDPPGLVQSVGSAVLVDLGGERMVFTAAHVLDHATTNVALYVGTPNSLELLQGRQIRTPLPASGLRRDDRIDVGAVRLPKASADRFDPSCFLSATELAPRRAFTEGAFVVLGGYPASRERRLDLLEREAGFYTLLAECAAPERYAKVRVSESHALVVGFDKTAVWLQRPEAAPERGTAPDLDGVSGGGVWLLRRPSPHESPRPLLCGIAIEWHAKELRAIVATKIDALLFGIGRYWPDLRSALP